MDGYLKPMPEPTEDSAPFWEGLRQHRFLIQRCADCGAFRHYPRPLCHACHSLEVEWQEVQGTAEIHSWTVCHHAFLPGFKQDVPYALALADLPEGVRVNLQVIGIPQEALRIGLPVRIAFQDMNDRLTLPILVARD